MNRYKRENQWYMLSWVKKGVYRLENYITRDPAFILEVDTRFLKNYLKVTEHYLATTRKNYSTDLDIVSYEVISLPKSDEIEQLLIKYKLERLMQC
jgi:hypothetical protein